MKPRADKADHPAAVDAELGRVGSAADAVADAGPCHIGCRHCGIDRTRTVLGKAGTAAAGEPWSLPLADVRHCDCHAAGGGDGVARLGGCYDQVIDIVAACISRGFKVGAADKADHPAAVDAEFGRVGTAADAVTDAAVAIGGRSPRDIDRTGGVFGKADTAAADDAGRSFYHIAHRHRHAAGRGDGVARLGGFDFQVVNVVAARIGRRFKVGAVLEAHHTTAAVDAELGRVGTAADAVADAAIAIGGRSPHGIDRTGAVLGKAGAAAAGDAGRCFHHIAHRHRHAAGGDKGVAAFRGLDDDVITVVTARIGRVFKVGLLIKLTTPLLLLMLNWAESSPPLML